MSKHSAEIETNGAAFVPCSPGYFALRPPGIEPGETILRRVAIVAWRIVGDTAMPITTDPPATLEELPYAVEFPDGHVEAGNTSWTDVQQYCWNNNVGPVEPYDD